MIEIAGVRGLTPGTILGHVEKLVALGKIEPSDLTRLMTPKLESDLPRIHAAFQELTDEHLSPIFEALKGVCSYDELRIARMIYRNKRVERK